MYLASRMLYAQQADRLAQLCMRMQLHAIAHRHARSPCCCLAVAVPLHEIWAVRMLTFGAAAALWMAATYNYDKDINQEKFAVFIDCTYLVRNNASVQGMSTKHLLLTMTDNSTTYTASGMQQCHAGGAEVLGRAAHWSLPVLANRGAKVTSQVNCNCLHAVNLPTAQNGSVAHHATPPPHIVLIRVPSSKLHMTPIYHPASSCCRPCCTRPVPQPHAAVAGAAHPSCSRLPPRRAHQRAPLRCVLQPCTVHKPVCAVIASFSQSLQQTHQPPGWQHPQALRVPHLPAAKRPGGCGNLPPICVTLRACRSLLMSCTPTSISWW